MSDYKLFHKKLKTEFIGHNFKYFKSTDSTNNKAWNLLESSKLNGAVILTDKQTMGRGRQGNLWLSSNEKSLTFSIILSVKKSDYSKKGILALIAGLASIKGIYKTTNIQCGLKWPNDIMLSNKKLGGILIESKGENIVIGIGINTNEAHGDLNKAIKNQAISLNIYNEKLVEIECLLAHILNQFESLYKKNNEEIINKWLDSCIHINQEIKFHQNQKMIKAIFKGLDNTGQGIINIKNQDLTIASGVVEL